MSPILVLLIIAGVIVAGMTTVAVVASIKSGALAAKRELKAVEAQLNKSEKALRKIANGAGNPELEAQLALDQLNELEK